MSNDDHRTALITGLRDLADFLETNPAVPAPEEVTTHHFPALGTDEVMRADVDRIAAFLGTGIDPSTLGFGHYATSIHFGPVTYKAVAIVAAARARHEAESSYYGCVQPDSPAHAA